MQDAHQTSPAQQVKNLNPGPDRQTILPIEKALEEIKLRTPHHFGAGHEGYYPHSAVAALVQAITSADRQHVPTDQAAPELLPCAHCGAPAWLWFAFPQSETPWFVSVEHKNDCILREAMGSMHCCASSDEMAAISRRADLAAPSAPAEVEGLVVEIADRLDQAHADLDAEFADAEHTGERPDLQDSETMVPVYLLERIATALTAQQAEIERLTNRAEVAECKHRIAVEFTLRMMRARAEKAEAQLAEARAWIEAEAEARCGQDDAYPVERQCAAILSRIDQRKEAGA